MNTLPTSSAAGWAKPVDTLEVGAISPEAINLNVQGRHLSGLAHCFGQLWRKTCAVRLSDAPSDCTPERVIAAQPLAQRRHPVGAVRAGGDGAESPQGGSQREHAMSRWLARLALIGVLLVTGASFLLTLLVWLGVIMGRLPLELAVGPAQIDLSSVLDAFTALAITVVAALIIINQPGNRLGWVLLLLGFSLGLSGFSRAYAGIGMGGFGGALPGLALAAWVSQVIWFMIFLGLELLLLLFPTGTLLSPRWRWVAATALLITACALALLAVGTPIEVPGGQVANPIGLIPFAQVQRYLFTLFIPFLITLALALLSLALRFHRATGVERQQIKWLLYVAALFLAAQLAASLTFGAIGEQLTSLVALGFPIAIGIAVLRYRLYDIDVVIRKTLLYTVLTALLALVYFGSVILLQRLFGALTGIEQSPLAVVVSTLVIAALFTPLRRRIQDAIDRRFYRKKYNAQQVLAQFAQTCRDETDLDALLAELVRVVDETLQPEHVSLWLKDPGGKKP